MPKPTEPCYGYKSVSLRSNSAKINKWAEQIPSTTITTWLLYLPLRKSRNFFHSEKMALYIYPWVELATCHRAPNTLSPETHAIHYCGITGCGITEKKNPQESGVTLEQYSFINLTPTPEPNLTWPKHVTEGWRKGFYEAVFINLTPIPEPNLTRPQNATEGWRQGCYQAVFINLTSTPAPNLTWPQQVTEGWGQGFYQTIFTAASWSHKQEHD